MKQIINGKRHDTETATRICDVERPHSTAELYLTNQGQFFLVGCGTDLFPLAQSLDLTLLTARDYCIVLLDKDKAQAQAERANLSEEAMVAAGFAVDEG